MNIYLVISLGLFSGVLALSLILAMAQQGFTPRSMFRWTRKPKLIAAVEGVEYFSPVEIVAWRVGFLSGGITTVRRPYYNIIFHEATCEARQRHTKWRTRTFLGWLPVRDMPARHRGDTVPSTACTCGFYAWKTQDLAIAHKRKTLKGDPIIPYGLSGIVIEHERGYRAQYARRLTNKEVRELRMEQ